MRPATVPGGEAKDPNNMFPSQNLCGPEFWHCVRLSSWLTGEINWSELAQPLKRPSGSRIEERIGYRVTTRIDRGRGQVVDECGRVLKCDSLIVATGIRPDI